MLIAALCAVVLSSCAGGPKYRDCAASLVPKPGKGLVIAYWTHGFVSGACTYHLYANEREVGHGFGRGSFIAFDAAPGPLTLATRGKLNAGSALGTAITALPTAGITLAGTIVDNSVKIKSRDVHVMAGETHFMRWNQEGFVSRFTEVARSMAERELTTCRWTNPYGTPGN